MAKIHSKVASGSAKKFGTALGMSLAAAVLWMGFGAAMGAAPVPTDPMTCFPTCAPVNFGEPNDARSLVVAGNDGSTLAGVEVTMGLNFTQANSPIGNFQLFDGDNEMTNWDVPYLCGGGCPDNNAPAPKLIVELYADATGVGGDPFPFMTWTPGAAIDSVEQGAFPVFPGFWSGVTFPHQATALNPQTGNYQYAVKFRPQNPGVDRGWNAFKMRSFGTVVLLGNQVVAFLGAMNFPNDVATIYPNLVLNPWNDDFSGSPYDGTWTFKFRLPAFLADVTVFDGDMDYGNSGCDYRDSDDPDTDNLAPPPFSPNAALEGVASFSGGGCVTGLPADDSVAGVFRRKPIMTGVPDGIAYRLVAPATPDNKTGQIFLNRNPSGNREWEQFKIQLVTDSDDVTNGACPVDGYAESPGFTLPDDPTDRLYPASDCRTADLPGGVWDIQLDGMDLQNLNFWFFSFKVEPIETEYSIGRLVWYDTNKNGVQDLADPTEKGIANVTYTVYDGPGPGANVVRQGVTDANGEFLETGLPAGNYTVVVDAANLAPGGPLFGWTSTTGGEIEDGVEVGLDICIDTNVPDGCGQPLYAEAIFGYVAADCVVTPENGGTPFIGAIFQVVPNPAGAPAGAITIRTTLNKERFVDNTYGTGEIGWPPGAHPFSKLVGSDHMQLALLDAAGVKKLEFKMDYVSDSAGAPLGYKTLGVTGGDGKMLVGTAANIFAVDTSISKNFRTYPGAPGLVTNSPATDASYTPNPTYPEFIFDVWYEVTFLPDVFAPAGFGGPVLTSVHASPSKTGNNTEVCVPGEGPNAKPQAVDDYYETKKNVDLVVAAPGVMTNDIAGPGGAITAVLFSGPSNGSLVGGLNTNGAFTYKPNLDFKGDDSFKYQVSNANGLSTVATVAIKVKK